MNMQKTSTKEPVARFESLEGRRLFSVDLLLDAAGLSATSAVTIEGMSYFFANNGVVGTELWKSDGTVAGTTLVKDLTPGGTSSKPRAEMLEAGERAIFATAANQRVADGMSSADYTLWASDGTAGGTVTLARFNDVAELKLKQVAGKVAISVSRRAALEPLDGSAFTDLLLYFSDGTAAGTKLVKTVLADRDAALTYDIWRWAVSGPRLLFTFDEETLWSSDGTVAGTFDLSPVIPRGPSGFGAVLNLIEADGKVVMPGRFTDKMWVTDGTLAGTTGIDFPDLLQGSVFPDTPVVAVRGKVYFVEVMGGKKTLWSFDLSSGELKPAFEGGFGDVLPAAVGDRVFAIETVGELDAGAKLYEVTSTGSTKVADIPGADVLYIREFAVLDGVLYMVVMNYLGDRLGGTDIVDAGASNDVVVGTTLGTTRADLWRSDGTTAGTGYVRTFYDNVSGTPPAIELTPVRDKLAVKFTYYKDIPVDIGDGRIGYRSEEVGTETNVYDPNELQIGRATTSARLLSGVLRLGGSTGDDKIRVWRSVRDPERLVVESNGAFRSFPFNSVRKIITDLQSGNDYFEILEGEGGLIRFRTSVFGGDGMDTIITGVGRDTISGGSSGDLIRSRGNADEIMGGAGRDRINGGVGDDQIAGGTGNDQIIGAAGVDVLFGQSALEAVFGREQEGDRLLEDVLLA